jgi:hypothetical protein
MATGAPPDPRVRRPQIRLTFSTTPRPPRPADDSIGSEHHQRDREHLRDLGHELIGHTDEGATVEQPTVFSQFTSLVSGLLSSTRSRSHRPKPAASPRWSVAKSNTSRRRGQPRGRMAPPRRRGGDDRSD